MAGRCAAKPSELLHKLNITLGRAIADNIVIDEALTEIERRR
jgi:hypothetical protein